MSYFRQIKIEDEDGNVIDRVDLTALPERDLLIQIIKELKILNMNIAELMDNEITREDVGAIAG